SWFDYPFAHIRRLSLRLVLVREHILLAPDYLRVETGGIDSLGIGRSDMHRDHAAEALEFVGLARGLKRHQDPDLAEALLDRVVHIAGDDAGPDRYLRRPPERHVLADLGDGVGNRVGDGDVTHLGRLDLLHVGSDRE